MTRYLLISAAVMGLAACSQPSSEATAPDETYARVAVSGAFCRPTPNGARVGACYLTLTASRADRLVAVETPASAQAEIHSMSTEGGIMRMQAMADGLALPAGQAVTLAPGGNHLMLIGLAQPLATGQTVALTLAFEGAANVTVQAPVQAQAPDAGPATAASSGAGDHDHD